MDVALRPPSGAVGRGESTARALLDPHRSVHSTLQVVEYARQREYCEAPVRAETRDAPLSSRPCDANCVQFTAEAPARPVASTPKQGGASITGELGSPHATSSGARERRRNCRRLLPSECESTEHAAGDSEPPRSEELGQASPKVLPQQGLGSLAPMRADRAYARPPSALERSPESALIPRASLRAESGRLSEETMGCAAADAKQHTESTPFLSCSEDPIMALGHERVQRVLRYVCAAFGGAGGVASRGAPLSRAHRCARRGVAWRWQWAHGRAAEGQVAQPEQVPPSAARRSGERSARQGSGRGRGGAPRSSAASSH